MKKSDQKTARNEATLRLFNAIQITGRGRKAETVSEKTLKRTVKNGYVLDPAVSPTNDLLNTIETIVGISGTKANASFHKSWATVRDTPMETLVLQQIMHYMTTYGFANLGMYSDQTIYVPNEQLDIPEIKDDIPLVLIKGFTPKEILEKIVNLGSGIALAQETLDDIMTIVEMSKYSSVFVDRLGNRELKARLYDHYGIVPSDPTEYLRHLISKLTDESLVIKNKALIEKIKAANGKFLDELLLKAPSDLATIFLRYKPLFLAMKSISKNKTFFNRLRKQAEKMHKPLPEDVLNSVTAHIKHGSFDLDRLKAKLEKASVFRKARLAYALKYRLNATDAIVYRVRNGRGWVTDFEWSKSLNDVSGQALYAVLESIADSMRGNIDGKTIYVPENVHYALPATEKQFTGHLPTGTFITVPEDMIVGIHWTNTDGAKDSWGHGVVDLDLSTVSADGKVGWDASYRDGADVLFSGDVTSAPAPKGASELFYFKKNAKPQIMMVNFYNFSEGAEVMTKILVASKKMKSLGNNYMVNPNSIIASANINVSKKQNVLGLITNVDGVNRFCFANVAVGNAISSRENDQTMKARSYLMGMFADPVNFREVLDMAGATIVGERPSEGEFIDLSPEALDKSTIIDLMKPAVQTVKAAQEAISV